MKGMQEGGINQCFPQEGAQACNTITEEKVGEGNIGIALQVRINGSDNRYHVPVSHQALDISLGLTRQVDIHADNLHPLLVQAWQALLNQLCNLCRTAEARQAHRKNDTRNSLCILLTIFICQSTSLSK